MCFWCVCMCVWGGGGGGGARRGGGPSDWLIKDMPYKSYKAISLMVAFLMKPGVLLGGVILF